jgi:hypothetical protein
MNLDNWKNRQIDKWAHYLELYEKHFAKYRGTQVSLLEIGVDHGGSLQLWKEYFGSYADITGVDINPDCKRFEEDQITIHISDQTDPALSRLGPFDIVIDDGSHIKRDQAQTFLNLWPHCTGTYLIEDCHDGFPSLSPHRDFLEYRYPWVIVLERPKRIIRGTPSRELRSDEIEARAKFGIE